MANPSACLAVVLLLTGARASAQSVMGVLSSGSGPYKEAFAGFEEEVGSSVPFTTLAAQGEPIIPDSVRVVVAFGSQAASQAYPSRVKLVYVLAPRAPENQGALEINMEPEADTLISRLKEIAPGLKKLGVLWISPGFNEYVERLRLVAGNAGVTIVGSAPDDDPSDIPDHLRELYGKVDALWLPCDPLLLNEDTFPMFAEFSRANELPFFVSTEGLVEHGATASIGPTFREVGRLAGVAVRRSLSGDHHPSKLYSTKTETVVNKTAAAETGLKIP